MPAREGPELAPGISPGPPPPPPPVPPVAPRADDWRDPSPKTLGILAISWLNKVGTGTGIKASKINGLSR